MSRRIPSIYCQGVVAVNISVSPMIYCLILRRDFWVSWQEIIKGFTAEEEKGHGVAASLVLMYLAFGQRHAYKMAKDFQKGLTVENGWKEGQLKFISKLKDVNQLHMLLDGMEKKGFLKSYKEEKGRRQRYFRLNEDIIISPYSNEGLDEMLRELSKSKGFQANEEKERDSIPRFLDELSERSVDIYFNRWSKIERFDYLTFLGFLKKEAQDMENEEMVILLNRNIHHILQGDKEEIKLKAHFETIEKIRSENKARGIKDELSPLDNLLDLFEENTK
jgi:hypothetical protein